MSADSPDIAIFLRELRHHDTPLWELTWTLRGENATTTTGAVLQAARELPTSLVGNGVVELWLGTWQDGPAQLLTVDDPLLATDLPWDSPDATPMVWLRASR